MHAPKNLELTGLSLEIVGLAILLLAAIWQASVTDWSDAFPAKSQYFIQETANFGALRALDGIALALADPDLERKKSHLYEASEIARKTMSDLLDTRNQVEKVEKTQTSWLKLIRHSLFVLGAALVIIGKLFVLGHKTAHNNDQKEPLRKSAA